MMVFWALSTLIILFGFVVFFGAPYVPSKRRDVERALTELYRLDERDVLVDVGSGDGIVLRIAAAKKARAVGYELNPLLVWLSRWLSRRSTGIEIRTANFWTVDWPSDTTVVYAFTVTRDTAKLARKMQHEANRLQRPLSLIVYAHSIPHMNPLANVGAHKLYTFTPLHGSKT